MIATTCTNGLVTLIVFVYACAAVIVTIDDIGDVVEGSETRITCNILRSSPTSVAVPFVTWSNVTNGLTNVIAQYQGGFGLVLPPYNTRFSVEGESTLVIANTLRSDSGVYQCVATIIDDPPSPSSDDVTLTVVYSGCYLQCLNDGVCRVTDDGTQFCECKDGFTGPACKRVMVFCPCNNVEGTRSP